MTDTGSKSETKEQSGLSHLLEHMCFKGTTKRPTAADISRYLDGLGAEYNAFTSHEYTGYYARAQAQKLPDILDVVADIYTNPALPATELEQEKKVIIEEINMYEDMPNHHVGDLFMELMYGDQPAGRNIAGTADSVRAITPEQLKAYHREHYTAAASTVVVAGKFHEATIVAAVEQAFSQLPQTTAPAKVAVTESQNAPAIKSLFRQTDQAHLILGVRTFSTFDPRNRALGLLAQILGGGMSSRLFQEMREKRGLGYYVHASKDSFADHGTLSVSAGVSKDRVTEALEVIIAEFKRLKTELVDATELERTKEYVIGHLYLGLEGSQELANLFGGQEVMHKPLQTPEQIEQEIRAITAQQIQKIAQDIFITEHLNLALIGPFKESAEFARTLNV